MNSILIFLHNMTYNSDHAGLLSQGQLNVIQSWYRRYCKTEYSFETALELMLTLYHRENFDFYPCQEYQNASQAICLKYQIDITLFREMIAEFNRIIHA